MKFNFGYSSLILLLCVQSVFAQSPHVEGDWVLTFEDEFNDEFLDQNKWHHGGASLFTNGFAGNTGENIWTESGLLNIKAEKRAVVYAAKSYDYASTEISTFPVFRQAYGYFEARIRYDEIQGAWPAFWLMPDRGNRGAVEEMKECYLKFDLQGRTEAVQEAILRVKVSSISTSNVTSNVSIHRVLDDQWTEESLTWNNKPAYDPIYLSQLCSTSNPGEIDQFNSNEFIEIDVTNWVNSCIENNMQAAFALLDKYNRSVEVEFHSKEAISEADRPGLIIDGVTLPASDDTYVRGGIYADSNYGSATQLKLKDPWASTTSTYDGGMEFDIMESLGYWGVNKTQHALHWDGYGTDHQSVGSGTIDFPGSDDGFHVYAVHWMPGELRFYVDDELTWTYVSERVASVPGMIILTHQVGGWSENTNVLDEEYPLLMEVDYVRVYEDQEGARIKLPSSYNNSSFPEGSQLNMDAEIIEYGGKVEKVSFYDGNTLLLEDMEAPYTCTFSPESRGEYTFSAKAYNAEGIELSADTITFQVADPPELNWIYPQQDQELEAGNESFFQLATKSSGNISKVSVYCGDTLYVEDTVAPYEFSFQEGMGQHRLFAIAFDELGLSDTSEVRSIMVRGNAIVFPWKAMMIGPVSDEGRAGFYEGEFMLECSGKSVTSSMDQQYFVSQALEGNGEILARIERINGAEGKGRGGLIIREGSSPDATFAAVLLSHDGSYFSFRRDQGSSRSEIAMNDGLSPPYWLKLVRNANGFRGYKSIDGENWIASFNEVPIDMKTTVQIGMFAASNLDDEISTTHFTNVQLSGSVYGDETPVVSLINPVGDTTLTLSNSILLKATASDPDGGIIEKLRFYSNGTGLYLDEEEPFETSWSDIPSGTYELFAEATDEEGSMARSDTITIVIDFESLISGEEHDKFSIYPLPSEGKVFIEFPEHLAPEQISYEIIDLAGKVFKGHTHSYEAPILSVSIEESGVFIIQVTAGEEQYFAYIVNR